MSTGMGVLIGMIGGNAKSVEAYNSVIDKEISDAYLDDNVVKLSFTDGGYAQIRDDGQSCCEHRYITTDDDLSSLVGKRFLAIEQKPSGNFGDYDGYCDVHEIMFVEIKAHDGTSVVLTTHNEHNGYYGGFMLRMSSSYVDAPA